MIRRRRGELRIAAPRATLVEGRSRVTATVNGSELWFESADAELAPSAEAFASALLLAGLRDGRRLVSEAPLSASWMAGARRQLELVSDTWGLPVLEPRAPTVSPPNPCPAGRTGLFFSGGVDSFHALLSGGIDVTDLVFVHGFEVRLDDEHRARTVARSVRAVATAVGARPIVMRTNINTWNGAETRPPWGWRPSRLAAIGHLLSGNMGRIVAATSRFDEISREHAEHWQLLPMLSCDRVRIAFTGEDVSRADKLAAIAGDPLARSHLRVCGRHHLDGVLNCSSCEKCLRTMVPLAQLGCLHEFSGFDVRDGIASRVDALEHTAPHRASAFARMRDEGMEPDLDRAVAALVERSELHARRRRRGPARKLARRTRHRLRHVRRSKSRSITLGLRRLRRLGRKRLWHPIRRPLRRWARAWSARAGPGPDVD